MIQFNQPQAAIVAKLAGWFGLPSRQLRSDVWEASGRDNTLLSSALLTDLGFTRQLRCVDGKSFKLKQLVDWKSFQRAPLYTEFLMGEGMMLGGQERYMLAFYHGGSAWVMRRVAASYAGTGGWYLADRTDDGGFVVEPLVNYLQDHCHRPDRE